MPARCPECEALHGDGQCPDCVMIKSWAEQNEKAYGRKKQPWAERKAAIERRKARVQSAKEQGERV